MLFLLEIVHIVNNELFTAEFNQLVASIWSLIPNIQRLINGNGSAGVSEDYLVD
jgi:hypothetical protein